MTSRRAALVWALVLAGFGSSSRAADWPMWRYDAKRSANSPQALPGTMYEQWMRDFGPPDPAWLDQPWLVLDACYEPVVAGSQIFVPSNVTGAVYALDTNDGAVNWTFRTDSPVRMAPACWGSNVYFVSDDGYLYCVDQTTGNLVWRFRGGGNERRILGNRHMTSQAPARGGPVIAGNTVYFGAGIFSQEGAFLHALNCADGAVVWSNSGFGSLWTNMPHAGAEAFAGVLPQGYLIASGSRLLVPSGRSAPGGFDINTGALDYFRISSYNKNTECWIVADDTYFYQYGRRYNLSDGLYTIDSSVSKIDIAANGVTYTGGAGSVSGPGFNATINGTATSLLAGDDRLFCVTDTGKLYCFGGTNVPSPPQYGPPNDAISPSSDSWTTIAADILAATGADKGYCLVWGIGSGRLIEELYLQSNLRIIAVDPSAALVASERAKWDGAGELGRRVWIYQGNPETYAFPPYAGRLVVSEDLVAGGYGSGQAFCEALASTLRPYGGTACFTGDLTTDFDAWINAAGLQNVRSGFDATRNLTKVERYGKLPGTADWTHQYGTPGNTLMSKDSLLRPPFGLLWYGGELKNTDVLPRHGHGPPEQVCNGRLVIEGRNLLSCVDVYTGQLLWQRTFDRIGKFHDFTSHESGANSLNTNYCLTADKVYVAHGQDCHVLDAETGLTLATWRLPREAADAEDPEVAHLRVWRDKLIVSYHPVILSAPYYGFPGMYNFNGGTDDYTASLRLAVLDRHTGALQWKRLAACGFRHNTICVGEDKVFVLDRLAPATITALQLRGEPVVDSPNLLMLNIADGSVYWQTNTDVFGTWLGYSSEHRILIQAGRASRDMQAGEPTSPMIAYDVPGKSVLWNVGDVYNGPAVIWHDLIMVQGTGGGSFRSLLTGGVHDGINALTAGARNWDWTRRYGCNTAVASEYTLTFRSGAAAVFDMKTDSGTSNLGGFKSSCTSNLVVANGVLNAPDYTRTCTCRYQNQASQAYIHVPDNEIWSYQSYGVGATDRIRRVGINFAAPGDRKDDEGTLWLDYPSIGYNSPSVAVTTVPASPNYVRKHSSYVVGGTGPKWVAAQYATDLSSVSIDLNNGGSRTYRVRVVTAQDAGGPRGELTVNVIEEFGISANDTITIDFTAGLFATTDYVCGVEVVEEEVLNDRAQVSIAAPDSEATEDDAADTGTIEITRAGGTIAQPLTVQVVIGGTAEGEGDDFALTASELNQGRFAATFPAGATTATITVEALGDMDADDDTVTVRVDPGNGYDYELSGDPSVTVFCRDSCAPVVANLPAANVTLDAARLTGDLQSTGGEATSQVIIYWGGTDGGTTPASWSNSVDLGQCAPGPLLTEITGLTLGTQYFYRCFADNGTATDWADATETFTTLAAPIAPTVVDLAATDVAPSSATLNGEVTGTGGEDPSVTIYWGATDGGTNPANWDNAEALGVMGATTFTEGIWGLTASTTYYFRAGATNSGGTSWAPATDSFTTGTTGGTLDVRVSAGSDDAEDRGTMYLNSSDLELCRDGTNNQWVGMRFLNMAIPPGATITNAYLQFTVDEVQTGTSPDLTIWGEAADNPGTFTSANNNISSRIPTFATVNWSGIPGWGTVGQAGVDQRTPDLSSIVQEIVGRPGWANGNAMVIIIDDPADAALRRTARSYENDPGSAPLLHVEYVNVFAPVVVNSPATAVTETGATLNGQVTDSGGDNPSVIVYWGPTDGGTDPANWDNAQALGIQAGVFSVGIIGLTGSTTYYFRCCAANAAGTDWADSTGSFMTPGAPNTAPVLDPIGAKSVDELVTLTFTITASDPDVPPQTLTFSATGLPAGATLNPGTGAFSWTPTGAQGGVDYDVTFTVSDDATPAATDSEVVTITVNDVVVLPPVILSTSPAAGEEAVSVDAEMTIVFSEVMNPATTEAACTVSGGMAWTCSWSADGRTLTLRSDQQFEAETTYTVGVGVGATSAAGTPLAAPEEFMFTTRQAGKGLYGGGGCAAGEAEGAAQAVGVGLAFIWLLVVVALRRRAELA